MHKIRIGREGRKLMLETVLAFVIMEPIIVASLKAEVRYMT